jgi:hypothetical protein
VPIFEWDEHNVQQFRAQQIEPGEAEQALSNNPIPVLEQDVEGDVSYLYYGETNAGRLLSLMVIENEGAWRVIMASELNPDQRADYLRRRARTAAKSRG